MFSAFDVAVIVALHVLHTMAARLLGKADFMVFLKPQSDLPVLIRVFDWRLRT